MQQAAYDLSTFEKREKQQKPRLQVAKGAKPKRKFDFSGLKVVATVAIIVSLAWGDDPNFNDANEPIQCQK